uniref:Ig-like domain-containing protein n=1 Tax=Sarcophilus harrisii TaxID=9305 RepID=A0A7N4V1F2_SARHA
MLLWVLLLILGLLSRQAAIAKKSVVEPRPSWTPILEGEAVTLICHGVGPLKEERAWWYKNQQLRGILSTIIQTNHPGEYRCQTQGSTLSDPVNLVFSSDPLILQTPYSVFEGDTLVLRCRGKNTGTVSHMTYYKDKRKLRDLITDFDKFLSLSQVGLNDSSKYQCTRVVSSAWSTWRETSKNVAIQVQELFSPPELKTTTSEPIEGTPVNLSCETQLSPQRLDTKLYFSFTRDGMVITSSGKNSHVLQIPTIQTKDSGSYRCEAKAVTQNILKQSNYVKISVKNPIRSQTNTNIMEITVALIIIFNLTIVVLVVYFKLLRKSGRSSTPNPYRVSSISDLQEPVYSNPSSQKELMPIYGNVNPVAENVVYSEVTSKEYGKEANNTKKLPEIEDSPVIYAEVKQKHQPRDSKKTNAADRRQDVAEN